MTVLAAIVPLFAIIALGFLAVRTGYVPAEHVPSVASVVSRVALPALIFQGLTGAPLGETLNPAFLAGYAGGSLAVYGLALALLIRAWGMRLGEAAPLALGAASANSGFMGYPIALALIGPQAATILAQCMIVENLLVIPLGLVLGAWTGGAPGRALRGALGELARSPVVVALAAALLFTLAGLHLPGPLQASLEMLARVSAPLALFVVGGTLATLRMAGLWDRLGLIVGAKLALHPAAVAGALWVAGARDPWAQGGVLFAAMPMLTIYPILAARAGQAGLAASALFAAVALSFATIPLVTALIGL